MPAKEFYVLSFNSTHHAIKAKKLLQDRLLEMEMIPTPRDITVSCGLAIRFGEEMLHNIKEVLEFDRAHMRLYRGMEYDGGNIYVEVDF